MRTGAGLITDPAEDPVTPAFLDGIVEALKRPVVLPRNVAAKLGRSRGGSLSRCTRGLANAGSRLAG